MGASGAFAAGAPEAPATGFAVPGTDFHAVVHRRIAITPIHLDLTGRRLLRRLKTWEWPLESTEATAPAAATDAAERDAEVVAAEEREVERR